MSEVWTEQSFTIFGHPSEDRHFEIVVIDKYKDLHPDLLTLENSRFYFRTMLLHWGALLIFSSSTFAIAYASAETDKGAELSTPLSFMDEQGTTNAGILPYASIPFTKILLVATIQVLSFQQSLSKDMIQPT